MEIVKGSIPIEGIKRCYVEGAILKAKCPGCGKELTCDLSGDYLNYPVVGEDTFVYFCCSDCEDAAAHDYEFECSIKVVEASIVIEYDPDSIKA